MEPKPDYEPSRSKDKILPKIGSIAPMFDRMPDRRVGEGFGGYLRSQRDLGPNIISVCNDEAVAFSVSKKFKSSPGVMKLEKSTSRDLVMYR